MPSLQLSCDTSKFTLKWLSALWFFLKLHLLLICAVVWNPWDKKAKAMADFGDDEYKHMLCVEAAAIEKPITLKPGEEWKGRLELSAVPSSYCSGQLDPQRVLLGSWMIFVVFCVLYR